MQKLFLPLVPLAFAALNTPITLAQTFAADPAQAQESRSTSADELTGPLTLFAALNMAFKANPELAVANGEVESLDGALLQAGVLPNPDITLLAEDTRKSTRTTTLQLSQPIELGGKRTSRIEAANRNRSAAIADLDTKRAEIRADVIAAFYDALTAQERLRLAQASVDLAQRVTTTAARRVIAGKVSPVEETKARIAESAVRIELLQANSELISAHKRLAATWGRTLPRFEHLEGQLEKLPHVPVLNELMPRLKQAPVLLRAQQEIERRQALTQIERSRQIPNLTVNLGLKHDAEIGRNQAMIGVSIPLPLFDRNQGNVQEALRRTDKARDELLAAELKLSGELAQAHERLHVGCQEAETLRQDILPDAQSAYDAATKGFELGKFGFLDVLDAQRTLFQARSQYLRVLAGTHRAAAEIERIVGDATPQR